MNNKNCNQGECSTKIEPEELALKRFKEKNSPEELALKRFKEKQQE